MVTWTPTDNLMTYLLVDKGFRFGGPNLRAPRNRDSHTLDLQSDS